MPASVSSHWRRPSGLAASGQPQAAIRALRSGSDARPSGPHRRVTSTRCGSWSRAARRRIAPAAKLSQSGSWSGGMFRRTALAPCASERAPLACPALDSRPQAHSKLPKTTVPVWASADMCLMAGPRGLVGRGLSCATHALVARSSTPLVRRERALATPDARIAVASTRRIAPRLAARARWNRRQLGGTLAQASGAIGATSIRPASPTRSPGLAREDRNRMCRVFSPCAASFDSRCST